MTDLTRRALLAGAALVTATANVTESFAMQTQPDLIIANAKVTTLDRSTRAAATRPTATIIRSSRPVCLFRPVCDAKPAR